MPHRGAAGASGMARPRQLVVCLLIAVIALWAPSLHAIIDLEALVEETSANESAFQNHLSSEVAVPDVSPPSGLVEERRGFLGGLAVSFLYQALKGAFTAAAEQGPRVVLRLIAVDLVAHTQIKEFWMDAMYFCTGSSMSAWITETYNYWTNNPAKYKQEDFQKKIDAIDSHIKEVCEKAGNLVRGNTAKLLIKLAAAKCSDDCGISNTFQIPKDWTEGLSAVFTDVAQQQFLNSFCTEVWEESLVIFKQCNIDVAEIDCSQIASEIGETAARQHVEGTKVGRAVSAASLLPKVTAAGAVTVGLVFDPGTTLGSLLLGDSGIGEHVQNVLKQQADAMLEDKFLLMLPNRSTEMVEEYCQKALNVSSTFDMPTLGGSR